MAEAARYGLYDLDRVERMILRRVARDYFLLGEMEPTAMNEELEQLLKNLKLRRMLSVYDEQLRAAEKAAGQLLGVRRRTAARAVARPPGKRAGVAHPPGESAGTLVAGNVSVRSPAGREPQADPRLCRTRFRRQTRESRADRAEPVSAKPDSPAGCC